MTTSSDLTKCSTVTTGYGNAFKKLGAFAISPYAEFIRATENDDDRNNCPYPFDSFARNCAMAFTPILLPLTIMTGLASAIAAVFVALSASLAIPVAAIADCCSVVKEETLLPSA